MKLQLCVHAEFEVMIKHDKTSEVRKPENMSVVASASWLVAGFRMKIVCDTKRIQKIKEY